MKKAALLALSIAGALALPNIARSQDEPPAPHLEFAFEETVTLGEAMQVGETPLGSRTIIPITGGTFEGPELKGTIIGGGWDWQLLRADGCTDVEADYMIRTDDGVVINVINVGVLCPPEGGQPRLVRTQPRFEAPLGRYDWLNRSAFIGTLEVAGEADAPAVKIRFYKAV